MKNVKKTCWECLGVFSVLHTPETEYPSQTVNVKMGEKTNVKIGGGGQSK
jgi:hypothetical protein